MTSHGSVRACGLELNLAPVDVLYPLAVNMRELTRNPGRELRSELETLLIAPHELVRLLTLADVAGTPGPWITAEDLLAFGGLRMVKAPSCALPPPDHG